MYFYLVFSWSQFLCCLAWSAWPIIFEPLSYLMFLSSTLIVICTSLWTMSNKKSEQVVWWSWASVQYTSCKKKKKWSEPSFVHLKWCFEFRMQKTFCYIADFNVFNKCNMQIKCSVYWVFKLKCTFHKYSFKRKHHFVYTNTLSVCQKLMYKYIF